MTTEVPKKSDIKDFNPRRGWLVVREPSTAPCASWKGIVESAVIL